ncbi:hypothetical protein C9I98_20035 [Photobacterium sanctipauli]|uniref:Fimbrial protein n=1 Tax=Photobacterium sanctipauli TaxID=1342794 RepID=A0A2T3NMV5_9GAMM|nr:hypothetical protein [Photobacterium sanctipauli]PSW16847.1 hypothetical protein C9I98_20035 [Photobacterium sanctipauli]
MNLLCKLGCLLAEGVLLSTTVQAATLNGTLEGGTLRWQNGYFDGSYLTLSNWQPVNGLQPTSEWVPGSFKSQPSTEITLTNGSDSVVTPLEVVGLDYGLGQASSVFASRGSPSFSGPSTCAVSEQQATTERVVGANCIASDSYQTESQSVMYTPFQFTRPVLDADNAAIAQQFMDEGVGSGLYSGTVHVNPAYYFKSPTGTWTYHQVLSVPITVRIRYEAARLEGIEVVGTGIMPALANDQNQTVSGEAYYDITASGFFTQGLKLSFEEKFYEMEWCGSEPNAVCDNPSADKTLPYSVDCISCGDESGPIVSNGVLQPVDGELIVGSGNTTNEIRFRLKTHYFAGADDIETGQYAGEFTVYFEEAL